MSVQTIVLYGNRLYDRETYSTNQDPQSLTATLSDTATLADSEIQNARKALSDSISSSDVRLIAAGIKPLSDTATLAEILSFIQVSFRSLSDSLTIVDNKIQVRQIKGLSDFIKIKDWLEIKILKADPWSRVSTANPRPSHIHLYGPGVYYGVDFYSSNPSVNWRLTDPNDATWQTTIQTRPSSPLYAEVLYAQKTYGSVPAVMWTNPIPAGKQAWTNSNGESHN